MQDSIKRNGLRKNKLETKKINIFLLVTIAHSTNPTSTFFFLLDDKKPIAKTKPSVWK